MVFLVASRETNSSTNHRIPIRGCVSSSNNPQPRTDDAENDHCCCHRNNSPRSRHSERSWAAAADWPYPVFLLILVWKKQAEDYLQKSGLTYTIVRPGGLKNEDNTDAIVMESADKLFDGSIPRTKVAQVCVEALFQPASRNKIVEIVAKPETETKTFDQLFAGAT